MKLIIALVSVSSFILVSTLPQGQSRRHPADLNKNQSDSNPGDSKPAKNVQEPKTLFTCLTDGQLATDDECDMKAVDWLIKNGKQNSTDCKKNSDPEMCRAVQTSVMGDIYSKCLFVKLNALNEATGQIDSNALKMGIIGSSALPAAQKTAAMATFDACLAANYTIPYSPVQYNNQNIPEMLSEFVTKFNRIARFGQLAPSITIFSIDCIKSALLQNGCAQVTAADLAEIIKELEAMDVPDWSELV